MDEGFSRVTRYTLEQVFEIDAGKFETHDTAVISIIGEAPLAAFESALTSLNYESSRYCTLQGPSSGTWLKKSGKLLPGYSTGLIVLSELSGLALALLEEELLRYWQAEIRPLLVHAGKPRFTDAVRRVLARYEMHCAIVQLKETVGANVAMGSERFVHRLMTVIEACLLPGIYPGMICIDSADIVCVHAISDLHVLALRASQITDLVGMLETTGTADSHVLAALYGPRTLKFREIHSLIESGRRLVHEDATFLQSAIADETRSSYTLYLVTSV